MDKNGTVYNSSIVEPVSNGQEIYKKGNSGTVTGNYTIEFITNIGYEIPGINSYWSNNLTFTSIDSKGTALMRVYFKSLDVAKVLLIHL